MTEELYDHTKGLIGGLYATFGLPCDNTKTKRPSRREPIHVSGDSKTYRTDKRRKNHIKAVCSLLGLVAKARTFPQIVSQCSTFEFLWGKIPETSEKCELLDVDKLYAIVEELETERSRLSNLCATATESNKKMHLSELLSAFLNRCPIINGPVACRLAKKWLAKLDLL